MLGTQAELHEKPVKQIRNRQWGWYHWSKTLKLTDAMKDQLKRGLPVKLELISKVRIVIFKCKFLSFFLLCGESRRSGATV